jgi:hypothetical protein
MGSGGIAPSSLTSALNGGEWSALRTGRFTSGETAAGTHCIGGWMGHRADLDVMKKGKISCPYLGIEPRPHRHAARGQLGILTELFLLQLYLYKETKLGDMRLPCCLCNFVCTSWPTFMELSSSVVPLEATLASHFWLPKLSIIT